MTGGMCGHDLEGSPVRVELFGHLDMKGLMYSARKTDMEKVKLKQCEGHVKDWKEMSQKVGKIMALLIFIINTMIGICLAEKYLNNNRVWLIAWIYFVIFTTLLVSGIILLL